MLENPKFPEKQNYKGGKQNYRKGKRKIFHSFALVTEGAGITPAMTPTTPIPLTPIEVRHEGSIVRKQEWESGTRKATNRSWQPLYALLQHEAIAFFKDARHAHQAPYFPHSFHLSFSFLSYFQPYNRAFLDY